MKLFIDTADIEQIREACSWGIVDGVTTNPTHVSKTGRPAREVYDEICRMVDGPVSLETISLDPDEIVAEARELAAIADNAVIKVPITRDGLKAVKRLSAEGIKTNVTVTFSPLQALLAAKCGATYISPFVGRLDAIGHVGMELVEQIRTIYDNYDFPTQVLVAAVRHPIHVLEAALAGADVCTMFFDTMKMLYDHPLTDIGIDLFLKDWQKVPKDVPD
ncbi:MAG: fructose-6-phosphate aldolase [Planctomycetes bacterium]|nr:fructose-6-phosphate aldolase [Planctomycetota bacterium]